MKKNILISALSILLMAVILLGCSAGLRSVAEENAREELLCTMKKLLPESESFTEETYTGEDANIRKVYKAENGFVIETCTKGYVDDIVMLVGVSDEGAVTGVVIREIHETAGLGRAALVDYKFLMQFLDTKGDAEVGTNVDAVSGATVTSKAVTRCVNSAVAYVTGADVDSGATSWGG